MGQHRPCVRQRIDAGSEIHLGRGRFVNDGTISPDGKSTVQKTLVTAASYQSSKSSVYEFDLDLSRKEDPADQLVFTGAARLAGLVDVSVTNAHYRYAGFNDKVAIAVSNTSQLSYDNLRISDTAAVDFTLDQTASALLLGDTVNLVPEGVKGSGLMLGSGLSAMMSARPPAAPENGLSPDMNAVIGSLLAIETAEDLNASLRSISPEAFDVDESTALAGGLQFTDALMSCRVAGGNSRFSAEGDSGWTTVDTRRTVREAGDHMPPFENLTVRFAAGAQAELVDGVHVGFGASLEDIGTTIGVLSSSDGNRLMLGSVVKARFGSTGIAASLTGGVSLFDMNRVVALPGVPAYVLASSQQVGFLSGQVRAFHTFELGDWYVRPAVAASLSHVMRRGFAETGGPVALEVGGSSQSYLTLSPSLEIGGEIAVADGLVRPFVRGGISNTSLVSEARLTAGMAGVPDVTLPWTVNAQSRPLLVDAAVGFYWLMDGGTTCAFPATARSARTIAATAPT